MRLMTLAWLVAVLGYGTAALAATRVELSGEGWTFKTTLDDHATAVTVPHSWMATENYRSYIGSAVYERDFPTPQREAGDVVRLRFDAVYDVATVWLNGRRLGTHEGGYTPFDFDVTRLLTPGSNHLVVEVNNTPTISSIPSLATSHGATDYPAYGTVGRGSIVGWMPYGGIVRPVHLEVTKAIFFQRMKIDAKPLPGMKDALLTVSVSLHNGGNADAQVDVSGRVAGVPVAWKATRVAANADAVITWTGVLKDAHLWSVKDPYLYAAEVALPGDRLSTKVGVRDVRVRGQELLLNGTPVHLFGANRVSEDLNEGLGESTAIIQRDMNDMLADNMRMMRIAHYPQAPELLEYADAHGMLLIAEAGNWNMSAWQMADPEIRARWKQQMREMLQQDWNHPSVIAWSVGNEYESFTKYGIDWTRDMRAFTLDLDPTRLVTFASRFTQEATVKTGADEASQYSDFVSVNIYGNYAKGFDRVHSLFPDKPVFVTEFGKMGEPGVHDPLRIADITEAVNAMKARPWMIGGSLWAWNDYRSLYPGTPASGIRSWGMVTIDRTHRDSWTAVQKMFAMPLP